MKIEEKLIIKNFGPIKELDIEIKPLMVFIQRSVKPTDADRLGGM